MQDSDNETFQKLRSTVFRGDAKVGVKDLMGYLRCRRGDPMLWPPRPELTIFGVKNCLGRLRDDLSVIEVVTHYNTEHHIHLVDEALSALHQLRVKCPPRSFRGSLGNDIVSAYVTLHRPNAFSEWNVTTRDDLEFNCLQIRDCILMRGQSVQFDQRAALPCARGVECEGASHVCGLLDKLRSIPFARRFHKLPQG